MQVKIYYLDGTEEEGEIEELPGIKDTGFYFHYPGNGKSVFVSVAAIKKIEPIIRKEVRKDDDSI